VRFLPPYSPDFNSIELTFATLKSWIRRHYYYLRSMYQNFGLFLRAAITLSRCDRFALLQFRHAAGGIYMAREDIERIRRDLE
jgi:transposase